MRKTFMKHPSFPIVAIGGSAGSFDAYQSFFEHMPADSGMAFIIIIHRSADAESRFSEIIQAYTKMPVAEATDGLLIQPNGVYIIPPDTDMGILNRTLLLLTASKPKGIRQPIDYFFQSLATDQTDMSVGVVFSGMGSDGETGVKIIKENFGLTIAQDPATAAFPAMPAAAIETNMVDYVLAPQEMPLKIIQYMNHPVFDQKTAAEDVRWNSRTATAIQKILMLLRSHTGNDFALYKKSTITRRIDRRIAFYQFADYSEYISYIKSNPEEIDLLLKELLIGVTKFFRDANAFVSLKSAMSKKILQKDSPGPLRVWIAGCSTGEEVYSVAMILQEAATELNDANPCAIQMYATDLDMNALEHARAGVYHINIAADVSPERIARFFDPEDKGFRVKKKLRDMIVFAPHNLIKDPPFIKLDLLCCRNLLIYFTVELQRKIIPIFSYALKPEGLMLLGPAETIGGFTELFSIIDPKWKLFRRNIGSLPLSSMIDFPAKIPDKIPLQMPEVNIPLVQKRSIADEFNRLLIDKFSPASVLVNERGDILYNNGKTGKYFELPKGETGMMNIHKLSREELKYAIASGIQEALTGEILQHSDLVRMSYGKEIYPVIVQFLPVYEAGRPPMVLVVFQDQEPESAAQTKAKIAVGHNAEEALQKELLFTKQKLTDTVEEMKASMDSLKLSNEELQSINEELQSTNEEALTTKEEMQSLNEELMTVNLQYQSKEDELTQLNNDMKNLLDATEVRTLFLDNELKIMRFTPSVRPLFNLIGSDIGRPLSHIASNFSQPLDETLILQVIDSLIPRVMDLQLRNRDWYRLRIMPYRTLDHYIAGAVLTLIPITDLKRIEANLNVLGDYLTSTIAHLELPTAHLDQHHCVILANQQFARFIGTDAQLLVAQRIDDLLNQRLRSLAISELLDNCLELGETVSEVFNLSGNNDKIYRLSITPSSLSSGKPLLILTVYESQ
jgi:two-component system CheB/CheR fusion protein